MRLKLSFAFLALVGVTAAAPATGMAATLTVVNQLDSYINVSVDGLYGCHTAGHTTCTIQVTPGKHALRAVKTSTGAVTSTTAIISEAGSRWTISQGP